MVRVISLWSFIFSLLCTALFFVTLQHPLLLSLDFYGTVVIFSMT